MIGSSMLLYSYCFGLFPLKLDVSMLIIFCDSKYAFFCQEIMANISSILIIDCRVKQRCFEFGRWPWTHLYFFDEFYTYLSKIDYFIISWLIVYLLKFNSTFIFHLSSRLGFIRAYEIEYILIVIELLLYF